MNRLLILALVAPLLLGACGGGEPAPTNQVGHGSTLHMVVASPRG